MRVPGAQPSYRAVLQSPSVNVSHHTSRNKETELTSALNEWVVTASPWFQQSLKIFQCKSDNDQWTYSKLWEALDIMYIRKLEEF